MKCTRFYDAVTGIFTPSQMLLPNAEAVAANTPAGTVAVLIEVDHLTQRVDIAATAAALEAWQNAEPQLVDAPGGPVRMVVARPDPVVVDYQPPAPADDTLQTWAWDAASKRWQASPTLLAVQLARWEAIKASRSAAIAAPLATPYGIFDADPDSQAKISGAVQLLQLSGATSIAWTLHDNATIELTTAQLIEVGVLLGVREQAAFATGVALRAQINAATDAASLNAIGWPA